MEERFRRTFCASSFFFFFGEEPGSGVVGPGIGVGGLVVVVAVGLELAAAVGAAEEVLVSIFSEGVLIAEPSTGNPVRSPGANGGAEDADPRAKLLWPPGVFLFVSSRFWPGWGLEDIPPFP